jgi:NADPH:quinone reductase-like Zn-dependent oxidoreductase
MRAYALSAGCRSVSDVRRIEQPEPRPRSGQVLVRVRAACFNRRDQAIVAGVYFGRPTTRDTIPLSDAAGEVLEVGEGVTRFRRGDRVVAGFFQRPPAGPPFAALESLGFPLDGALVEQMVVYEDGLLPIPGNLSFEEAACLPCAAVTAWNALMVAGRPVQSGDTVLVLGTGGVSMFALQFALAVGARVIATSSSDEKLERVKRLGAAGTVNYRQTPDWHRTVLEMTGGRGVDCVVEVGGVGTLERSVDSIAIGGKIALIGVLTGRSGNISPYGIMWKSGTVHGIRVGTIDMFERMNRAIEVNGLHPIIDAVVPFDDAIDGYELQNESRFIGTIVVSMT